MSTFVEKGGTMARHPDWLVISVGKSHDKPEMALEFSPQQAQAVAAEINRLYPTKCPCTRGQEWNRDHWKVL